MENKLGSYINNLMTTIVDKEEKWFVRGLAYNELTSLKDNINEVLISHDELGMIPKPKDEKDKNVAQASASRAVGAKALTAIRSCSMGLPVLGSIKCEAFLLESGFGLVSR